MSLDELKADKEAKLTAWEKLRQEADRLGKEADAAWLVYIKASDALFFHDPEHV